MSIEVKNTTNPEDAASLVAVSILNQLQLGKHVLFFVTGGSAISVAVKVADILREHPKQNLTQNLTIMLTDERYGPVGHQDSNWQQLFEKGFHLPQAKQIPILTGDNREITTEKFNATLKQELVAADYRIALFGIGKDGHTGGMLPESPAVTYENFAFGYDTETFSRITVTPKVVEKLEEVVVWVQGEEKWGVVESLKEKNIDITKQPAQILKKVPLLTIFTDYKKHI